MRIRLAFTTVIYLGVLLEAGCGDYAANRHLSIYQFVTDANQSPKFELDTSRIPAASVIDHEVRQERGGDVEYIRISPSQRIRVVIIPEQ